MTGKTLSAHVDLETAKRISTLSEMENRSKSQIASASIKLGSMLPHNAWSALLQLNSVASEAQWQEISQEITRVLLHHQYKLAQDRIAQNIDQKWLDSLETEDDLLLASVELTRNA
jgi:predicted transcriptional regulator